MSIIIDTDPGIDDAIAIFYALRSGMDVSAITTLAGNLGLSVTTRNAGRVLALAGRRVPVHAGAATSLRGEVRPELAIHGEDGLGGVAFPPPTEPADPIPALDAMLRLIAAEPPGTVTLFCLGPMTNLARLIQTAPDAAKRLGPVIAMGGAIDEPGNVGSRAEFNIAHDADAANIVLAAALDLTLIPLDATRRLRADPEYIAALRAVGTAAATATADLIAAYLDGAKSQQSRPLHDPCVPLLFARPDLFTIEQRRIGVDLATGALEPGPYPLKIAMRLEAGALRDELKRGLAL